MNETLATYLTQIARQLGDLPPQQRDAELQEVQNHLGAMIEARVARGVPRQRAEASSLAQFGRAQGVGKELARAWHLRQPERPWRALVAALSAVACQIGFCYFYDSWLIPQTWTFLHTFVFDPAKVMPPMSGVFVGFLQNSVILTPIFCGWLASLIAPYRGWWAALTAYLSAFLVLALLSLGSPQSLTKNPGAVLVWFIMILSLVFGAELGKRRRERKLVFAVRAK